MTTGEKIRELRKAKGLTQEELAQKIGIKRGTLAQYETGKRSPKRETLERFAKALNVQWYELAHTDDSSWNRLLMLADDVRNDNAPNASWYGLADSDIDVSVKKKAIESFDKMKNSPIRDKAFLEKLMDSLIRIVDTCMDTENKDAGEALERINELIECQTALDALNEAGERAAYYKAMQLLEPGLDMSLLVFRIWKEKPEKVGELIEILQRTVQMPLYCKSGIPPAGDAPEGADQKKE